MNLLLSLALAAGLSAGPSLPPSGYQPNGEIRPGVFWKPKQAPPAPAPATGEIVMYHHIESALRPFIEEDCKLITTDAMFGCLPEAKVRAMVANLLFTFDNTYIDEARDCDDLAWEFIVKFRRFHREVTDNVPLAASAGFIGVKLVNDVPEMGYLLDGRVGYHAIVIIRCQGGKWLLVDPGTKRVSEFTQHLYSGDIELRLVIF